MKGPARILVIDDDEDVRTLVKKLAQGAGYTAAEAPDGRSGLRSLLALPPDVVILDVDMPGLDGCETLERIRDLSDVPVLMLSAIDGSSTRCVRSSAAPTTT